MSQFEVCLPLSHAESQPSEPADGTYGVSDRMSQKGEGGGEEGRVEDIPSYLASGIETMLG